MLRAPMQNLLRSNFARRASSSSRSFPKDKLEAIHPNFLVWTQTMSAPRREEFSKLLKNHWSLHQQQQSQANNASAAAAAAVSESSSSLSRQLQKLLPEQMNCDATATALISLPTAERQRLMNLLFTQTHQPMF